MAGIPIGLELYSVREAFQDDPRATIKAVAGMDYQGVEFAGPPVASGAELRAMLDEAGLVCCGWHTPWAAVQDDRLEETIALNRAVGNPYVIIPGIPRQLTTSREDWLKLAEFFNGLARRLAPHGMFTGYHNHHLEFQELDGEPPWDTFIGHTDKGVIMQLDLGNAARGGADVVDVLRRYPGRARSVHLKPYSFRAVREDPQHDPNAGFRPVIGEDDLDWGEIFRICETSGGTDWYVVEYESDAYPPLEAVERCLKALRAMGK
jgi:sugar phosphate isomerase/epimerase